MRGSNTVERLGQDLMDEALVDVVRATRASAGLLYVLPPGEDALWLTLLMGGPKEVAAPWMRVALSDPVPAADAVREERMVWISGQEEMAHHYPRVALVLPYAFALVAAPVQSAGTPLGALVLLLPGAHPPHLRPVERQAIDEGCRRMGELVRSALEHGDPPLPVETPHVLTPEPRVLPREEAAEVGAFLDRLPGGCCSLGVNGRITYADPAAAELLGTPVDQLVGSLPWEALPWMNALEAEHGYRTALLSRQPTTFTAFRPPEFRLVFHLYPDATGISVRVDLAAPDDTSAPRQSASGVRAGRSLMLSHVMHLAVALTEAVGVDDVIEQTADHFLPALGAQGIVVMGAEEGRMRILGHRGYADDLVARFDGIPLTADTPGARATSTGVPTFFRDVDELERVFSPSVYKGGKAAWAYLPLIASGRTIGTLLLAYDRPRPFPPSERATLTALAGLVGQALDRARLYDTKNRLAHRLQSALLPRTLPEIPGLAVTARYLPAAPGLGIGGDFYDVIHLGPHSAAAAIGDVQGHNMDAAALMGQVRTAVHAQATVGARPDDVLAATNQLLNDLDPGLFTSCLYAQFDLVRHRACLATAGHTPPVLRHADGHAEVIRLPPGLLLGIEPGGHYPSVEFDLPPGSVLALFTDGLIEAPGVDPDDAATVVAGLLEAMDPDDLDAMADTLVRHTPHPVDDIALLLLRPR